MADVLISIRPECPRCHSEMIAVVCEGGGEDG